MNLARSISFKVPIVLLIITCLVPTSVLNTSNIVKGITAMDSKEINFDSPFNNTFDLGIPLVLVEYDNTTTLKPIGIRTTNVASEDFEVTFLGFGIINYANNTIRYNSNGSGVYITNPDGTVKQKGIIMLRVGEEYDTAKAEYESIGHQAGEERVTRFALHQLHD